MRHLIVDGKDVASRKIPVTPFFSQNLFNLVPVAGRVRNRTSFHWALGGLLGVGALRKIDWGLILAKNDTICVAAIMGAFGAKGEVRLKSFCAQPEDVASYGTLTAEDGSQSFELTAARPVKGGFAVRLKGIRFRDEAEKLRGVRLFVPRTALPNLPDDEYYYSDLISMTVVDTGGVVLGKVRAVQDHGAGDILEIRLTDGGDILLPFTLDVVPTVDLTAKRIVVDLPDGVMPDGPDGDVDGG